VDLTNKTTGASFHFFVPDRPVIPPLVIKKVNGQEQFEAAVSRLPSPVVILAEILATGYLRLQAQMRAEAKNADDQPNLSPAKAIYPLANRSDQSDEWNVDRI
jgi:hypothetical protein